MEILVRMSSTVVCLLVSSAVLFLLSSSSVQGLRYGPVRRFFNGTDQSSVLGSGKAFENGMVRAHTKERRVQESDGEGGGCGSCRGKETVAVATEEMGVLEMGEEEVVEARVEDEAAAKEMEKDVDGAVDMVGEAEEDGDGEGRRRMESRK
ncbi:hypothetical protein Bca52824_034791 [Brassica carinata]|uniref:Uncharacterized protein n=1 Tax=Brassica carinata TaxID=52824 RepID=A0A8X7V153_BRACI|nr:hypothetical protein Bca52824_034791 [Brassica carinata]